jgi:pimeloyl-ACP methyl ester carboxylesterase
VTTPAEHPQHPEYREPTEQTEQTEQTLVAIDGVRISAVHVDRAQRDLCFVVVHGFTGNWREERVAKVIDRLTAFGSVVALDMRGHGRSGGRTTLGHLEVHDVAAAVEWARELGYRAVVTVGFSLGGAVVLREAGLSQQGILADGRVDAVVSVSAPAFWNYRGTRVMRLVHHLVETRTGRLAMRATGTRVTSREWSDPLPLPPHQAASMLGPVPLLVVHGDVDRYFPIEHPQAIHQAAAASGVRTDMWLVPGFGHAESAISADVLDRIGTWARECVFGEGS